MRKGFNDAGVFWYLPGVAAGLWAVGCRKAESTGSIAGSRVRQSLHFCSMPVLTTRFLPIFSAYVGNGCKRAGFPLDSIWTRPKLVSLSANTHQTTGLFLEWQIV